MFEEGVQLALDGVDAFDLRDARMNVLMQCVGCTVPGRRASPSSTRREDRILYCLITRGVVRVGFGGVERLGKDLVLDEVSNASADSARNYVGGAVRGISGLWVSSHVHHDEDHPHAGYVLGHLRTSPSPCTCRME